MASTVTETGQKVLLSCKKCGTEHEKPTGNKCERLKLDKSECDEKWDVSKDASAKKTPKGKSVAYTSNQDKMMEIMLASMSTFTKKLTAMEERITGLTNGKEEGESSARKSRSREKKKRKSIDESQEPTFMSPHPVLQSDEGVSYSCVFSDTAVTFKPSTTPTKAKKQKGDIDLGVKPLTRELIPPTPMRMVAGSSLPCSTATITRPDPTATAMQAWDLGACGLQETNNDIQVNRKQPVCDFNQNVLMHTDQFGNPVSVQGIVEQPVVGSQKQVQQLQLPERHPEMNVTSQSLEALRANPFIQQ